MMNKNIKKSIIGAVLFSFVLCIGLFVANAPQIQNNSAEDSNVVNKKVDNVATVADDIAQKNQEQTDALKIPENFPKTESEVYNYSFSEKNSDAEVNQALRVVLTDRKAIAEQKAANRFASGFNNVENDDDLEYKIDANGLLTIQNISSDASFTKFDSELLPPWQQDEKQKYSIKSVNINGQINPKDVTAWFGNVRELETSDKAMKIVSFTGLKNMILPKNCAFLFCGCTHVEQCDDLPAMDSVENACAMFSGASFSENIINNAVAALKQPTNLAHAFGQCPNLTNADFNNEATNLSEVENFSCTFLKDTTLLSVAMNKNSAYAAKCATTFDYMFYGCSSLEEIQNINNFVQCGESLVGMFEQTAITSLDISGWDMSKVNNVSNMFNGCSLLTTINAPKDLDLNDSAKHPKMEAANMFTGCYKLQGQGDKPTKYIDHEDDIEANPLASANVDGMTTGGGLFSGFYTIKLILKHYTETKDAGYAGPINASFPSNSEIWFNEEFSNDIVIKNSETEAATIYYCEKLDPKADIGKNKYYSGQMIDQYNTVYSYDRLVKNHFLLNKDYEFEPVFGYESSTTDEHAISVDNKWHLSGTFRISYGSSFALQGYFNRKKSGGTMYINSTILSSGYSIGAHTDSGGCDDYTNANFTLKEDIKSKAVNRSQKFNVRTTDFLGKASIDKTTPYITNTTTTGQKAECMTVNLGFNEPIKWGSIVVTGDLFVTDSGEWKS